MKRQPPAATSREDRKSVRSTELKKPLSPSWRFSTVDKSGPFAWPDGIAVKDEILQKLTQIDSMHWGQIEGAAHHSIDVDRLSKAAQERLLDLNQDDVDEVFSFHISGRKRIIGIRDMNVVKLLWWDPEHQVCPSLKKHT